MNALGLPVTIHLEDHLIPLPQSYTTAGTGEIKEEMAEAHGLWRTDTDGDLAKWLNNGFTPRAEGGPLTLHDGCVIYCVCFVQASTVDSQRSKYDLLGLSDQQCCMYAACLISHAACTWTPLCVYVTKTAHDTAMVPADSL